jgi:hypothetical protein
MNWMTDGRTYGEQRFSPLKQIDDRNISQLGLAWYYDLDTHRGQEATPLVVDGVNFTSAWSKVFRQSPALSKGQISNLAIRSPRQVCSWPYSGSRIAAQWNCLGAYRRGQGRTLLLENAKA